MDLSLLSNEPFNYCDVYSLRPLGANVRQSNRVTRAAVESFDAKLPVQGPRREILPFAVTM